MYSLHHEQRSPDGCEFINSACKYYTGQNDLTLHITHREAVSGTVIHSIFDMWYHEVVWTCTLTGLLWYAFDYVHSILYIIQQSSQLPNALHCMLPCELLSHAQAHSQLHLMTLPTCLTICCQVSSQNTLKHTHEYALKYTPHLTWTHTPILLDYPLPNKLS